MAGRSTLNPNAPLFIPAALRQVEDFSPEWWELINTAARFHDEWLRQHQGENSLYVNYEDYFDGYDGMDRLSDSVDVDVDEQLLNMEQEFEEFIRFPDFGETNIAC